MRRTTVAIPGLVFAAAVVMLLGPSLVGAAVTVPNDLLLQRLPWSISAPADLPAVNVELRDVIDTYYPIQRTIWTEIRSGRTGRWLHDLSLGLPGTSFIGWGAFSVFNIPATVLPFDLAWSWAMALRLLTAMAGAHVLVRSLGAGRLGGIVAGLAFGLSGFMVGWLGWPQSHVGAVIPWVLWAAARTAGRAPPWWSGPVLAVVTAALWLGGFPAVSLYALIAAGVVAVHAAWPGRGHGLARRLVLPAGAVVAGTALVAALLMPSVLLLEQFSLSYRDIAWQARLPVRALATFIVPRLFGHPLDPPLSLGVSYVEGVAYAGVTTLVLAGAAWLFTPRRAGVGLFTALGAGAAAIAYGVPGIQHAVGVIPMLRTNPPTRVIVITALAIAVLGGLGIDSLKEWLTGRVVASPRALAVAAGTVGVLAAVVVAAIITPGLRSRLLSTAEHSLVAGALVLALLATLACGAAVARRWPRPGVALLSVLVVVLVMADTLGSATGWNSQPARGDIFPPAPGLAELREASEQNRVAAIGSIGQPNTHLVYGFRDVRAHTFVTPRQREVYVRLGVEWLSPTSWTLRESNSARWEPWLGLLGVSTVMAREGGEQAGSFRVHNTADMPLGPLVHGELLASQATAPLDGTIEGLRFIVGTYQRSNEGQLEVTVHTTRGARSAGALPVAALPDLRPVTVPIEPLPVSSGDELIIQVTATASTPDRAITLLGGPSAGLPGAVPTLALVYSEPDLDRRPVAGAPRLELVNVGEPPPLVYAVPRTRVVPPGEAMAALETLGLEDLTEIAVVESADGEVPDLAATASAAVERWTRSDGEITAAVRSSDGAVVVALDQALDGWSATVGGEPAPLMTVNHLFIGVAVPPGSHEVVFTYRTPGARAGTVVSLAALLLLCIWTFVALRGRRP